MVSTGIIIAFRLLSLAAAVALYLKYIMMTMMSQRARGEIPTVEYDEYDEQHFEMRSMRTRMDTPETGSSSPVPELQAEPMGHPVPLVRSRPDGYVETGKKETRRENMTQHGVPLALKDNTSTHSFGTMAVQTLPSALNCGSS
jgi:hypothetical protein